MEIQEYDVSFMIKRPNRPPQLVVTYICLSEEHFKRNPSLKREELITRNSLFLLSDRYDLEPGVIIRILKYKPVHHLSSSKTRGIIKKWRKIH